MLLSKLKRLARLSEDRVRQIIPIHDPETKRERDAQSFWSRPLDASNSFWWHARDGTCFQGADENWRMIGQRHTSMFAEFAKSIDIQRPVQKIVDWGCGGGANAVAFAPECREMWGVDISADALLECSRQVASADASCEFHPLQVTVPDPEAALKVIPHDIDLFHCLYVFEVFPSQEYGRRILRLAKQLLRPGGVCFVQIKYETGSWKTRSRRWGYTRGVAHMTSYRIDEFWQFGESCGLEPKSVVLVPKPPEVPDVRYAYFFFKKPMGE
jgi:methylase of polypeptide subunit release factors